MVDTNETALNVETGDFGYVLSSILRRHAIYVR